MNPTIFEILIVPVCGAVLSGLIAGIIVRSLIEPLDYLFPRRDEPAADPGDRTHPAAKVACTRPLQ